MMSIQPSEADRLTLYDYSGLLYRWQEAHKSNEKEEPTNIDTAAMEADWLRLERAGIARVVH